MLLLKIKLYPHNDQIEEIIFDKKNKAKNQSLN